MTDLRNSHESRGVGRGWCSLLLLAVVSLSSHAVAAPPVQDAFTEKDRAYWAFQPIHRPQVPTVDSGWASNPIDAFVLKKLDGKGITPGERADKVTLIRRASFDLIGLPPTPEQVEEFLSDESPDAFAKLVDRLLDSPHYGERWGRHWLDLARYADSEGFKSDETRPNAWRYRDYVIRAFNEDKPFDRFVREQIAGDELWPDDPWAHVATAFNRHYPDETNQINLWLRRQEILQDMTDTVGAVFLGLTYGCAKCHDHKFDPLLQSDYYRMQAFYANTKAKDDILIWSDAEVAEHERKLAAWEEATRSTREAIDALLEPARKEQRDYHYSKLHPDLRAQVVKPEDTQTPFERQMFAKWKWQLEYVMRDDVVANRLDKDDKCEYQSLKADLAKHQHLHPGEKGLGTGLFDLSSEAPPTHILKVANYANPEDEVQPGFPSVIDPEPAKFAVPEGLNSTGRRTALANWLADPKNPLTPRVMVNRIWHYHFGRGIVSTPSDFGRMGERPTHPELLDWLADEFIRGGWSVKHMHRLIMNSNTYQQSSAFREDANQADSFNRYLWRFQPQRMEGEVIRDSALLVAGALNPRVGGPTVFPPLPRHQPEPRGGWQVSEDPADHARRSIYIFVRRNARYPMLEVMDMPDTHETCGRRVTTMTAPQALSYLNGSQTMDWARSFAGRLIEEAGADRSAQIERAYRIAFSRTPDAWERDAALTFLDRQKGIIEERREAGGELALPTLMAENAGPSEAAALVDFCHSLLNSNEFVFRY